MPYMRLAEGVRRHVEPPLDAAEADPVRVPGLLAEWRRRGDRRGLSPRRADESLLCRVRSRGRPPRKRCSAGRRARLVGIADRVRPHASRATSVQTSPQPARPDAARGRDRRGTFERILAEEGVPPDSTCSRSTSMATTTGSGRALREVSPTTRRDRVQRRPRPGSPPRPTPQRRGLGRHRVLRRIARCAPSPRRGEGVASSIPSSPG